MKINVAQQLKEHIGSVRWYTINELIDKDCHVQGKIQLLRTNRSILVTGDLKASHRAICSRCTEEFNNEMMLTLEEEYLLPRHMPSEDTPAVHHEIGICSIDENNILDLNEAINQQILISMPMKPICKQNCAGLCVQCGCNLNYESCTCIPIDPDSPWAPLKALLQKNKGRVQ